MNSRIKINQCDILPCIYRSDLMTHPLTKSVWRTNLPDESSVKS